MKFNMGPYKSYSPCLNCKDRYSGCHDKCKTYQDYLAMIRKAKIRMETDKFLDSAEDKRGDNDFC